MDDWLGVIEVMVGQKTKKLPDRVKLALKRKRGRKRSLITGEPSRLSTGSPDTVGQRTMRP